jgi:transcription initiation factor IIF auxiliary subunit
MVDIRVKHELLKRRGKVRSRRFRSDGAEHFKLRLFLEGQLGNVESVEYELHPTFQNPVRKVTQREGGFPLDLWTWGEFEVPVTVRFKDGSVKELVHDLSYSDDLPRNPSAYTNERGDGV